MNIYFLLENTDQWVNITLGENFDEDYSKDFLRVLYQNARAIMTEVMEGDDEGKYSGYVVDSPPFLFNHRLVSCCSIIMVKLKIKRGLPVSAMDRVIVVDSIKLNNDSEIEAYLSRVQGT